MLNIYYLAIVHGNKECLACLNSRYNANFNRVSSKVAQIILVIRDQGLSSGLRKITDAC